MPESNLEYFEKKQKEILRNKLRENPGGIISYNLVSKRISQKVKSLISKDRNIKILEIGVGCGRIIKDLLNDGFYGSQLSVVESDPDLFKLLKTTFSSEGDAQDNYPSILLGDACDLNSVLSKSWLGHVDIIISTVPLFSIEEGMRREITEALTSVLSPGGKVLHITYGHMSPIYFMTDIQQEKVASTWWNVPPAFIWKFIPKVDKLAKAA